MCVFTDRKYIKRASYVLVPLMAINTFVGCAVVDKTTIKTSDLTDNKVGIEIVENLDYSRDNYDKTIATPTVETSSNLGEISPFDVLSKLFNESNNDINTILSVSDRNSDLYASALYAKAKSFSLNDDVILRELENIICFGTQATCVDEYTWYELFGNLVGTISEYDNVVDYYYPLASYVHRYSCTLSHKPLFFDENRIVCDEILRMYEEKNPTIDYVSYVKDMVFSSEDNNLIEKLSRILDGDIDKESAIFELDNIYYLSMFPTDLSEELWNQLFGNLMSTINSDENVCSVYYDLACYVHTLFCDLEHTISNDGIYGCVDDFITLEK